MRNVFLCVYISVVRVFLLTIFPATMLTAPAFAQEVKATAPAFKPSGKLWGLAYGDFAYKDKSDFLNRGGVNQYTGIKQGENLFQFRRIYLGYDYKISKRFSAEFLLAVEDNLTTTAAATPVTSGDLLADNKLAPFVKLANLRWKRIYPGADLVVGQVYTPAFVLMSEAVWDYRCIERTVADIRRTPAYDMGAAIQGKIFQNNRSEVGYNLMTGNGTAAKPDNDAFKWFYGDIYARLFGKRVVIDVYSDYTKINWTPLWHHDRCMIKGFAAYTTPKFTVGIEAFMNTLMNDSRDSARSNEIDTATTRATAVSLFVRGRIWRSKLGFFARYDSYDPGVNNKNSTVAKYTPFTSTYDPNTREGFITAGLDYSPISKIHIMPNVWYNMYNNEGPVNYGANNNGADLVYRLSIYYVYGK